MLYTASLSSFSYLILRLNSMNLDWVSFRVMFELQMLLPFENLDLFELALLAFLLGDFDLKASVFISFVGDFSLYPFCL
jgi:hypothetical protein